jgi:hypothetical protein
VADGKLLAAGSSTPNASVQFSADGGLHWQDAICGEDATGKTIPCPALWRAYDFFQLGGKLYVSSPGLTVPGTARTAFLEYEGDTSLNNGAPLGARFSAVAPEAARAMFPIEQWTDAMKILEGRVGSAAAFASGTVYLAGATEDGHQLKPIVLAFSTAMGSARAINLVSADAIPRDIRVAGDVLFVLLNRPASHGGYTNAVSATRDLETWTEVLRFDSDTFARSFELAGGFFYFGMGCSATALSNTSGDVLRIAHP